MGYSKHSLNQKNKMKTRTDWEYEEGVFLTPNKKWICRVKKMSNMGTGRGLRLMTLSQHETEEEAQKAYNKFYN